MAKATPDVRRGGGEFGALLRDWRRHRGLSQQALAQASGVSQRHISFLETGRASPGRPSIVALAEALHVPLRERNALLRSAGHAPLYPQHEATTGTAPVFRQALEAMLAQQEPYPALVADGRWNLVMLNGAAERFFGQFVDLAPLLQGRQQGPWQLVTLCLSEGGLKPHLCNWQEFGHAFLQRARRALLINPRDRHLAELIDTMLAHPEAPPQWHVPDWAAPAAPAVTMQLQLGDRRFRLLTMQAHFGALQEVQLEELSVELFYPADEATRAWFTSRP